MSKIGIYNEPSGGTIGGSEVSVAVLAAALSNEHEVSIIHHRKSLTAKTLEEFSSTDVNSVQLCYVKPQTYSSNSHSLARRYRDARDWHASLSQPYDVFINFTHHMPAFCHAPKGILVVLFPLDEAPFKRLPQHTDPRNKLSLVSLCKRKYHQWEWKKRMSSYQQRISISQFTRSWVIRRWAIESEVIYPPVDTDFRSVEKKEMILSVGRFATEGHAKNQLEMMCAFQELVRDSLQGWTYSCVGGLGDSTGDRDYFGRVARLGANCGAETVANVPGTSVRNLYENAQIFWHAAGYGMDKNRPEQLEHFGIATVEAMAAGCIPLIFHQGGQTEVVEHGVNGFLWSTLDELKAFTLLIARDEALRLRLSASARTRAQLFNRGRYVEQFRAQLLL